MNAHGREARRQTDGSPLDAESADEGAQLHLVFSSPTQEGGPRRFAPKLTIEQRRAAVRMRREGNTWKAVAQRFGVCIRSVRHLFHCGRYGAIESASLEEPASTPSESRIIIESSRLTTRKGVDLIIYDLPLDNYRVLEQFAEIAGCSAAAFALELLACATPPTSPEPAKEIRRVGLRHLLSTWRSEP